MSRRSLASALLAPALLLALAAVAQSRGDSPPDRMADHMDNRPPQRGEAGGRPPGPPIDELRRTLSLDDRQAQAVAKILEAHRAQVEQLHARTRAEHDALASATDAQLRKVLDARQFEAFQTWKQTHRPPPFGGPGEQGGPRGQGERRPPMGPPPTGPQGEG